MRFDPILKQAMPCPLFEPVRRVTPPSGVSLRLPLIFEFEGICHAANEAVDRAHRFRYCNHGNARGRCHSFPPEMLTSALRFNITDRTASSLKVEVVEEENYWPRAWSSFEFLIQDSSLVPEIEDKCRRAQVFHFCRSFLDKF